METSPLRSAPLPGISPYDFVSPQKIVFGWGRRAEVGKLAAALGRRAFLVCGSRTLQASRVWEEILASLADSGVTAQPLTTLAREPRVEDVDAATAELVQHHAGPGDLVLAIGGGSAIDLGKATAAMATNGPGQTVKDYLEGVGKGLVLSQPCLPVLAMPTTAGTGSEATKNAVISSHEPRFKKSLRSDSMMPRVALLDPELTTTAPAAITAQTGMDAITQLIESYISAKARPIPQALALAGLRGAAPALLRAIEDPSDRPARETLAHAALLSGMALANSGLGMAHGVAAALGVHFDVPHGLACAVMLPVALRTNRPVCEPQYAELARAMTGHSYASESVAADALLDAVASLYAALPLPKKLSELGVSREHLPRLAADSRGSSMSGNPRTLSDAELVDILEAAL